MTITAKNPVATLSPRTDAELVEAAKRRETGAYGELFGRWYDRSYDVALNILRDRDAAADVAQDAFLVGWEHLADLRDPAAFGGWILRTTRNRALNRFTRDKFRGMAQIDTYPEGPALRDPDADPAVHAVRSDQRRLVWTAAAALGERDTSLLDLHLRHGLGPTEIAEELQLTPNNAKQLLFQLRRKLRETIGAVLLWRDGRPRCADLATLVSGTGPFDGRVARMIRRHQRDCQVCQGEISWQTDPERMFASVPFAVVPVLLKERAANALAQAGIQITTSPASSAAVSVQAAPAAGLGRVPLITGVAVVTLSIAAGILVSPMESDRPASVPNGSAAEPTPSWSPSSTKYPSPSSTKYPSPGPTTFRPAVTGAEPATGRTATGAPPAPVASTTGAGAIHASSPPVSVTADQDPFCRYSFNAATDGAGHFTGQFVVTNISGSGWRGWAGSFMVDRPLSVQSSWGGMFSVSGTSVTVTPAPGRDVVPPGASVVVGLSGSTSSSVPRISGFSVEGHLCQGR